MCCTRGHFSSQVWLVADTESFGAAAQGGEGMYWPCVYHDHSKNFDGGWMGFAKAHSLRTSGPSRVRCCDPHPALKWLAFSLSGGD